MNDVTHASRGNKPADLYAGFERTGSGCLVWTRGCFDKGYGAFTYRGRQWRTHRLVWWLERGPIPDDVKVCHRCDNPPCGEIGHLFLGTQLENVQDMYAKGRQAVNGTYERTDVHRARLREVRLAESAAKYGDDVPRSGMFTDLPQRVPPSVPPGAPLAECGCVVCGQRFLAPAVLAHRYSTCSRECSSRRRSRRAA